ncbi:MAG: TolC family protein [Roseburia sp.]|nr:TolC family protein [Roseburia sp.]MCM1420049.1 TolC family protein [Bacteroides sp.]
MNILKRTVGLLLFTGGCVGNLCSQTAGTFTLEEIFALAEESNRDMSVLRFAEQEAAQGVEVAKNARLPDINVGLSVSYLGDAYLWDREFGNGMNAPMPHFGNNFVFEASQVVYAGGAVDAGIELARLQRSAASVNKKIGEQELRLMLAGNYLELFKLGNMEKVYLQNIAQTQKLIEEIEAKQKQGTALKNDVTRYELQLKGLELAVLQLRNNMAVINHKLCIATGLPENTEIVVDTTMADRLPEISSELEWQDEAVGSSPLLQRTQIAVDSSKERERLARAERMPSIALFAGDKLDGPVTVEVPPIDKNLNYWYVGVGVKYSLSSLFKTGKSVRLARVAVSHAEENRLLAHDNLRTEVKDAYVHFDESFAVYDTQMKSLDLARQNYAVINNRYLNGLALVTDMLDASNMKLNAELQVVNARIGILFNYYKLKKVAGKL